MTTKKFQLIIIITLNFDMCLDEDEFVQPFISFCINSSEYEYEQNKKSNSPGVVFRRKRAFESGELRDEGGIGGGFNECNIEKHGK